MSVRLIRSRASAAIAVAALAAATTALVAAPASASGGFLTPLNHISTVASTVPANGDINPYGVAVVPATIGRLQRGDVLVSNFNDAANAQGTGRTVVEITPAGRRVLFAQIGRQQVPGGVGLTTALVVLRSGWVLVGNLPTSDGTSATARAGSLLVLDAWGRLRGIWTGNHLNGPWDATAADFGDHAQIFVTNVLNGTVAHSPHTVFAGTVVRLSVHIGRGVPQVESTTVIGSGFPERTDPAALVVGPTGLALGRGGTLYVADTERSRIAAIPDALSRTTSAGDGATVRAAGPLNQPLGLTVAPAGDLVTVNGGDGRAVELTPSGEVVAVRWLDRSGATPGAGALFGLAPGPGGQSLYFVDDATNTLDRAQ